MHKKDISPSMRAFEKGLRERGLSPTDAQRALGLSYQAYYAWRRRRIPPERVRTAAKLIKADPDALEKGRYSPLEVVESPRTDDGREVGIFFEFAPSEWQERIRTVINDYLRVEAPDLARYLGRDDLESQYRANRVIEAAQKLIRRKPKA